MARMKDPKQVLCHLQDRPDGYRVPQPLGGRLPARYWRIVATTGAKEQCQSMVDALRVLLDKFAGLILYQESEWRELIGIERPDHAAIDVAAPVRDLPPARMAEPLAASQEGGLVDSPAADEQRFRQLQEQFARADAEHREMIDHLRGMEARINERWRETRQLYEEALRHHQRRQGS